MVSRNQLHFLWTASDSETNGNELSASDDVIKQCSSVIVIQRISY